MNTIFIYSQKPRKAIYTTNGIELHNSVIRHVIKWFMIEFDTPITAYLKRSSGHIQNPVQAPKTNCFLPCLMASSAF